MDLTQAYGGFIQKLITLLPLSPFRSFLDRLDVSGYLGLLNYFIPVAEIIAVLQAWVTAITLYYVYSVIARWVRLIGS